MFLIQFDRHHIVTCLLSRSGGHRSTPMATAQGASLTSTRWTSAKRLWERLWKSRRPPPGGIGFDRRIATHRWCKEVG